MIGLAVRLLSCMRRERCLELFVVRRILILIRGLQTIVLGPREFWDSQVWRRNRALADHFRAERKSRPKSAIVLVQLQKDPRLVLPSLYVAVAIGLLAKARPVIFKASLDRESRLRRGVDWIWSRLALLFQLGSLGIYSSIGARSLLRPQEGQWTARHEALFVEMKGLIRAKEDVVNLSFEGVQVGDLFYDQLLKAGRFTIDLDSEWFWEELRKLVSLWLWWEKIFDNKPIVGVVSTAPYLQGLPLRIAVKRRLISIEPSLGAMHTRRFSIEHPRSRMESLTYREEFERLGRAEQLLGVTLGRKALEQRITQGVGGPENLFANQWSQPTGFQNKAPLAGHEDRQIVVVYCHEFTDAPNTYPNLFPDYWEWLGAIGEEADTQEFRWIVKPHPAASRVSLDALEAFARLYPQVEIAAPNVTNAQFLARGVVAGFTMYGSVGLELAYHNVPVINASQNNPHVSFNFNVNPDSKVEFSRYVRNPRLARPRIVREEIYACYYMTNIKNAFSYFYDFRQRDADLGARMWEHYFATFDGEDHSLVLSKMKDFIRDGRYQLDWSFFGAATKMNTPLSE